MDVCILSLTTSITPISLNRFFELGHLVFFKVEQMKERQGNREFQCSDNA